MVSSSGRRSGSSGASRPRKRVVIDAERTKKVEYRAQSGATDSRKREGARKPSARSVRHSASGTARQAKRVSNAKREERERRQRIIRARRTAAAIFVLAVVAGCVGGALWITRLPVFGVQDVRVEGVRHLDAEAVRRLADIRAGTSIIWMNKREVVRRVTAEPWVDRVVVDRDLPNTVVLRVTERKPAVIVDDGGEKLWTVSTDSRWLGERSGETSIPVVRDVRGARPARGHEVESPEIRNAVRIARGLSPELLRITRFISAPTIEKTALMTTTDVEIFIGSSEDVRRKDRIVREILRQQKDKVIYINVRVVESPTWRGLD